MRTRTREGGPIAHLDVVDGELRYYDNRFPIAPGTADDGADANAVHARQHYELVNWHVADDGLNYRRFFAVNTLAAVRVENPDVFADSHVEIKRWFDEGLVDGLRVDHPDGLHDPQGYLDDLAELTGGAYVLVEKILETGEHLPASWSTEGTTGYDALAHIDRVLTDPAGQRPLDALETRLRGRPVDWLEMIHDTKRAVTDGILRSEVLRLTRELVALPPVEEGAQLRSRRGLRSRARLETKGREWAGSGFETLASASSSTTEMRPQPPTLPMRWRSCWLASRSTGPTSPGVASTSTRRSRWRASTGRIWPAPSTYSCPSSGTRTPPRPSGSNRRAGW